MSPEEITEKIKRLALENGGKPLGQKAFFRKSGLSISQLWSAGFSSYSDAIITAGFDKNRFNSALPPQEVLASLIRLMRSIGQFPTKGQVKAARSGDKSFPSYEALATVAGGTFSNLPAVALEYCRANGISDIEPLIPNPHTITTSADATDAITGYVYLVKHGQHYKVGRSNDVVRRRREISLLLPQELEHVHVIETDDPEGIEAYWHRRFGEKRVRGEWFALTKTDVTAFKRRRYQ